MIRLIHKETIKDKTKYDYETDNFSTHRRHDIMFTGTGKKQNGYRKRQSGEQKARDLTARYYHRRKDSDRYAQHHDLRRQ